MDRAKVILIESEIYDQMRIINKLFDDIDERKKGIEKSVIKRESTAYKIHSLYCAFEDLFEIVARYFENQINNRAVYHKKNLE